MLQKIYTQSSRASSLTPKQRVSIECSLSNFVNRFKVRRARKYSDNSINILVNGKNIHERVGELRLRLATQPSPCRASLECVPEADRSLKAASLRDQIKANYLSGIGEAELNIGQHLENLIRLRQIFNHKKRGRSNCEPQSFSPMGPGSHQLRPNKPINVVSYSLTEGSESQYVGRHVNFDFAKSQKELQGKTPGRDWRRGKKLAASVQSVLKEEQQASLRLEPWETD